MNYLIYASACCIYLKLWVQRKVVAAAQGDLKIHLLAADVNTKGDNQVK